MGGTAWFFALTAFAIGGLIAGILIRRHPLAALGALLISLVPPLGMAMIPIFC